MVKASDSLDGTENGLHPAMSSPDLERILEVADSARILLIGDCVLDVNWQVGEGEGSIIEVAGQDLEIGGICNLARNFQSLGFRNIRLLGVLGDDLWGREVRHQLSGYAEFSDESIVQEESWSTPVHLRRHLNGKLLNRQDFGLNNRLSAESAQSLERKLEEFIPWSDVVVVYQKFLNGVLNPDFLKRLQRFALGHKGTPFIVNLRNVNFPHPDGFWLKLEADHAAKLAGIRSDDRFPQSLDQVVAAGKLLQNAADKPLVVSRGDRGALLFDGNESVVVPSVQVLGRVNSMGAGDALLSGYCAGLLAGLPPQEALYTGVYSASVALQAVSSAGSPSVGELRKAIEDHALIYHPELADDPRRARYLENTEFEIVESWLPRTPVEHAIFDHDGTISTLRQGWEEVMEPVMLHAILGDAYSSVDEGTYSSVRERVREFIDQTTGIQTLVQMQGLVQLVREFRFVPEEQILDEFGYKEIYNEALMDRVRARTDKLKRGELGLEDFTLKGAVPFLYRLHEAGVRLYLASGTDEEDVVNEAATLGYAPLFEGGIFGAVGDVSRDAKREVLNRILQEIGPGGGRRLVTFGDGPVEMRETRKLGGFAVGLASDELQRFGLNRSKRSRLIRAGAHLVAPDFSQLEALLDIVLVRTQAAPGARHGGET